MNVIPYGKIYHLPHLQTLSRLGEFQGILLGSISLNFITEGMFSSHTPICMVIFMVNPSYPWHSSNSWNGVGNQSKFVDTFSVEHS